MTRLLHLLGRAPDHQAAWMLDVLRNDPDVGADATVRTIGRGGAYANAFWAVIGLRRAIGEFDVIHAWDERALAAAALAGGRRIIFSAPPELSPRDVHRLRFMIRRRDARVVCSSRVQHDRLKALGLPCEHVQLIRPCVEAPAAPVERDVNLRRQLDIADSDFVLLAPGESTRAAAHERAVWTGSILHVTDERYRVLLWGRGPRAHTAAALGRKLRQPGLVVVAERALGRPGTFEELLPAADAVLATARGPVTSLPLALAMAAGVPIISPQSPLISEFAGRAPIALTTPADAPRLLAQRVLDLREDANLRQRVVAAAQSAARTAFEPRGTLRQYRDLYASTAAGARR